MPDPPVNPRKPSHWWNTPWTLCESCTRCSEGCRDCWALAIEKRGGRGLTEGKINLRWDRLDEPLHWRKPRVVAGWNDFLHPDVPNKFIATAWYAMAQAPHHVFIVLTKRANRLRDMADGLVGDWHDFGVMPEVRLPLPNVILGVTCESNEYLWRVEELVRTPAACRFVNAHLLGPLDLRQWTESGLECSICEWAGCEADVSRHDFDDEPGGWACPKCGEPCAHTPLDELLDWLACECNRPFHGDPAEWWGWCESLVSQADAAGVPVWVKQGPRANGSVTHDIAEFPQLAQRREFPKLVAKAKEGETA